jgi:hypothetical protein
MKPNEDFFVLHHQTHTTQIFIHTNTFKSHHTTLPGLMKLPERQALRSGGRNKFSPHKHFHMNNSHHFQKTTGILSIAGGIIAFASLYLTAAGSNFNTEVFENPRLLLGATNLKVSLLRWSMIADMFGYYLLLVPVVFYFQEYLKTKTSWSYLISWCGSSYAITGAIGAAILAVVWPSAIVEYPIATHAQQEIILRNFDFAGQIVYQGIWNTLEMFVAGIFWLGLGFVIKKDSPVFGWTTVVLGAACLADGVGNITGIPSVAAIGLNIYLLLSIAWQFWAGLTLLNRPVHSTIKVEKAEIPLLTKMIPAS